jgi:5'-deoxynucleotidase
MVNGFGALMHRMNYINRWGLMRNTRYESLGEHTFSTAYIAHLLACIANEKFKAGVRAEVVACCALYHDATEVITGDMPTPVKYSNDGIRTAYKDVEKNAQHQLIGMMPEFLHALVGAAITGTELSERERQIMKAADKLSALIKCLEEEANGNTEFESARQSTMAVLRRDPNPETIYFLEEFIPAYKMTLDELMSL